MGRSNGKINPLRLVAQPISSLLPDSFVFFPFFLSRRDLEGGDGLFGAVSSGNRVLRVVLWILWYHQVSHESGKRDGV